MVALWTASLTSSNSTFCPHREFMCFVWISEQTAIISLYNINWLVCITETECVYCAVRTGYLYNSASCPHTVFMCFVWIWEQTAIISLYNINWLVCITETECVYCAVRTGSVNVFQFSFESFHYGRVKCGTEKMILASWTVQSSDIEGTCNISATGSSFLKQVVGWGPFFAGYERKPCTECAALGVVWKLVTVRVQSASIRLVCRPKFVRHSSVRVSFCGNAHCQHPVLERTQLHCASIKRLVEAQYFSHMNQSCRHTRFGIINNADRSNFSEKLDIKTVCFLL